MKADLRQLDAHARAILDGLPPVMYAKQFDPYQWWMVRAFMRHRRILLGAFMGSGKTATALRAFTALVSLGEVRRALVVAPLNVANDTWPNEILTWAFSRDLTFAVATGTPEQRAAAIAKRAQVTIINRENFRWLLTHLPMNDWDWDVLIYDEASRLKEGDFKTKKTVRPDGTVRRPKLSEFGALNRAKMRFKYIWELSGTPCPEGLMNLWGPVFVLDNGARLGRTRSAFAKRWFKYDPDKYKYEPFDHSEKEITDRLKDIVYVLKEEDYINLPPLRVRDRLITLPEPIMRKYKKFVETLALEEFDVEAVNNGVLCNKLLQFANGSIYSDLDEEEKLARKPPVARFVHDYKLKELESIRQEAEGRPLLIAYSYKFDLWAIKKRYPKFRVYGESPNDLRDWNLGRLDGLIIHPASAGHGLNFQKGSNVAVWFGLNWSLELYQQFNKRLHRRGQEGDYVWLYRILARGTMDMRTANMLSTKGLTQDRISDAFRVELIQHRRKRAA